jgi:serine/threonine protein kinase/tetratricopeptide (TPR) repeat protein
MVIDGKYALLSQRAEGAEGPLFEAQNAWTGRRVALKLLHPRHRGSEQAIVRFLQQARTATQVEHPNIVDVLDMGQDPSDGSFYIVQEFLRGHDLREELDKRGHDGRPGALTPAETLEILLPILGALEAVHLHGILHRDVKPENIFLARDAYGHEVPKLIDFGVARVSASQARRVTWIECTIGTLDYMSPEQARSDELDARTDVWSMGVVLYEALAGVRPFEGPDDVAVLARLLTVDPKPLTAVATVPEDLAAIVHRALSRDLDRRFASMAELARALLACSVAEGDLALRFKTSLAPLGPLSTPLRAPLPPVIEAPRAFAAMEPTAPSEERVTEPLPPPGSLRRSVPPPRPRVVELAATELETTGDTRVLAEIAFEPFSAPPSAPPTRDEELGAQEPAPFSRDEARPAGDSGEVPAAKAPDALADEAERALSTNALDAAVAHAEEAILLAAGPSVITGRMRLVQAIAHGFRGRVEPAARAALEAMELLQPGSAWWFEAAAELAAASGRAGQRDRLAALVAPLVETTPTNDEPPATTGEGTSAAGARVIAALRLSSWLLRTGDRAAAASLQAAVADDVTTRAGQEPRVSAWRDVLEAESAVHAGDAGASILCWERAIAAFAKIGDARNACVHRQNLANAYRQVGAFRQADACLVDVLSAAEAMQLDIASLAKANHAVVLARQGEFAAAAARAREARDELVVRGDRRGEAFARLYLAGILSLQRDFQKAEEEARAAIACGGSAPDARAYAYATLGALLLRQRKRVEALVVSARGMELLRSLGGVEEGESLIRLVHAVALRAAHYPIEAREALLEANERLRERAARISDEGWRTSFLENIAENAHTVARAARLAS